MADLTHIVWVYFQFFHFKKMLKEAGKKDLEQMNVTLEDVKPLVPKYEEALKQLREILEVLRVGF